MQFHRSTNKRLRLPLLELGTAERGHSYVLALIFIMTVHTRDLNIYKEASNFKKSSSATIANLYCFKSESYIYS